VVRDTVEEQRLANPKRTILLADPREPVLVEGDEDRLRQVITNFLGNALKYSAEDRPVEVSLSVEGHEGLDGQLARVEVRDQGTGIPADELERVWGRFQRATGAQHVSGSSVGLGLGLYISREIVKRHGGTVGAESTVGQGSTFWFTLPMLTSPPPHEMDSD
jgi:signal transduction histidine kinase